MSCGDDPAAIEDGGSAERFESFGAKLPLDEAGLPGVLVDPGHGATDDSQHPVSDAAVAWN